MKHIFIIILITTLLACNNRHASPVYTAVATTDTTENWETYLADYNGAAGSTIVNMSLSAHAPYGTHPFLLVTGVKFTQCEEGLPAQAAFAGLYNVSDSVKEVVTRTTKSILAGTFTHECKRLDYYYTTDSTGLRTALTKLYVLSFPGYEASIHITEDKQWDAYLKFLYPNEATLLYIQDQKVVDNLAKSGDNPSIPRPIAYGLYFPTSEEREQFISFAQQQGYAIESKATGTGALPYELTISKIQSIDINIISKTSLQLSKQAAKNNGEYDGWGSPVMK